MSKIVCRRCKTNDPVFFVVYKQPARCEARPALPACKDCIGHMLDTQLETIVRPIVVAEVR
jgi:hypothetical protein